MDVSVMTFNLRVQNKDDGKNAWKYRSEKVIETIKKYQPDLLGTQEGLSYMVQTIGDNLSSYTMIGEGRGGGTEDEYGAIFYRQDMFFLVEEGQFWLSKTPHIPNSMSWDTACPRICTWGHFRSKKESNQEFVLINTHLDHVSQEAREEGIKLVCDQIDQFEEKELAIILTGDFNIEPSNPVIDILEEHYLKAVETDGKTFHNFEGGKSGFPIDYIFISSQLQTLNSVVDRAQIKGRFPSDHYPVIAELRLNKKRHEDDE